MAYPAGVQTVTLRLGSSFDSAGTLASISGHVAPLFGAGADHLVWGATGQTYAKVRTALAWDDTEKVAYAVVPLPTQAGWTDPTQAAFSGWSYQISAIAAYAGGERQVFGRTVTPGAGDTVIDVDLLPNGVAATPTVVAEWEAARADALAALAATEVEQVTLTEDLAYELPATVAPNRVHSVAFTQDATGGHTVTFGGDPVTVDTDPGASTLVEIWPGGEVTYPGAAPLSSTYARNDVSAYGAVGDGVTDDTAAFVAAATDAVAAGQTFITTAPGKIYHCPGMDSDDMFGVYIVGDSSFTPTTYVAAFTPLDWVNRDRRPAPGHGRIAIVHDGGTDPDTWPALFPLSKRLGIPVGLAWPTSWDRPWLKEAWRHGWEIMAHGVNHEDMSTKTEAELHAIAQSSVASIAAITGSAENINFTYPFHARSELSDRVLSQYFTTGRALSSVGPVPEGGAHSWVVPARLLDADFTGGVISNRLKAELHAASATDGRLNYYFHDVSPETLAGVEDLVRYARTLGIAVVRPSEMYGSLQLSPPHWEDWDGWTVHLGNFALATDRVYRGTKAMKFTGNASGGGNAQGAIYSDLIPVVGHVGQFTIVRVSFRYWLASPLTVAIGQGLYLSAQFYTRARSALGLAGTWGSGGQVFGGSLPEYPGTSIAGVGTWVRVSRLLALSPDVTQMRLWLRLTHVAENQEANPMWIDDFRVDFVDRTAVVPFVTTLNGTAGSILRNGPVPVVGRHPITVTPLASTAGRVYVTPGSGTTGQRLTVYSTDNTDTTQAVQVNVHAGYSWSDMSEPADGA